MQSQLVLCYVEDDEDRNSQVLLFHLVFSLNEMGMNETGMNEFKMNMEWGQKMDTMTSFLVL